MSHAVVPPSKYFTASGIVGSYLTAGDSYDFRTKTVVSNKSVITTPKYSEETDTDDILDRYQASFLSSRVVDQVPLYNLGSTQTPSGFPKDTPKFEIKFYRNGESRGYFSEDKYTVSKILYDYSYGANLSNLQIEETQ
jgi:cyanophycinase